MDNVIIHEAARPFVGIENFKQLITMSKPNVTFGCSIPFTVLKGKDEIEGCLNRSKLISIQIPQKFEMKRLLNARRKALEHNEQFTEDASLFFTYEDAPIKVCEGRDYNIKITTSTDLIIGAYIYTVLYFNLYTLMSQGIQN